VRVKGAICAELIAASTPINFAELERLGVLEEREGWHVLLKRDGLPSHARRQLRAVRQVRVAGCVTTRLKFRTTKKAAALLAKITGGAHSMERATL